MTVRQLYGVTTIVVAGIFSAVGLWLHPPRDWKILKSRPAARAADNPNEKPPVPGDGYREVSEWLKNNLNDPDFEKVQWWPLRSLADLQAKADKHQREHEERVQALRKKAADDVAEARTRLEKDDTRDNEIALEGALAFERDINHEFGVTITHSIPKYACRLRYRTKNEFGAKVLHDQVFSLDRGRVVVIDGEMGKGIAEFAFPE